MNSEVIPRTTSSAVEELRDKIDLAQLFGILWNGKWTLIATVGITLLLGGIYLIAARPIYQADGLVQVEQNEKSGGLQASMGDLASLLGTPMETTAEIQILQSRMILSKVINTLNLEIEVEPKFFPVIGRFVARLHAGAQQPSAAPFGLQSFAWGGEVIDVAELDVPDNLAGKKLTLVAMDDEEFRLFDPEGTELLRGRAGSSIEGHGTRIFVRELKARSGTNFNLVRYPVADVLKRLTDNQNVVEQGKQSGIIGITYQDYDPARAAAVVRQIEDAYLRQNVERHSAEAQQSLEFLQRQLPEIRGRVDAAQARLNTYQIKQGSVNVTKETDLILQQSVDLEAKRLEIVQQRQLALQRFTAQHPAVQALDAQIRGIESEQNLIKKRSSALPETQQEVLSLMRDLEVNTQLYTTLLNSAQELQVAKAGTVGNVRIIDYPLVPNRKAKPKSFLILAFCAVTGCLLGTAMLFIRKALFHGVDRPDEVERALGIHTYAAIPYAPLQKRLAAAAKRKQIGSHILAAVDSSDVAIEALRSFRTSLQFALMETSSNVIMFTGPTPGLGKSFISVNLGAVLAAGGGNVVVLDADLRRGHLHKYIGEHAVPGISDYVAGNADVDSIKRSTSVPGLSLVPNGTTPPNPAELLMHERFSQLIKKLSVEYDIVIIDTPPVLPVTDASIVGRLAGSVFMVLKEGAHPMKMIEESVRRLRLSGISVRGSVFNQVGSRGGSYYGYYSTYSYSYQSKYKSEGR